MTKLLWTEAEAAEALAVPLAKLRAWVRHEGLPFIPYGEGSRGAKMFRPTDVESWLEGRTVTMRPPEKPAPPPPDLVAAGWDGVRRVKPVKSRRKEGGAK